MNTARPHHYAPVTARDALRDQFAAAAMPTYVLAWYRHGYGFPDEHEVAKAAYKQANAMLAERSANSTTDVDVAELLDFVRDADCGCRAPTERYEAHTCQRCRLLALAGEA